MLAYFVCDMFGRQTRSLCPMANCNWAEQRALQTGDAGQAVGCNPGQMRKVLVVAVKIG